MTLDASTPSSEPVHPADPARTAAYLGLSVVVPAYRSPGTLADLCHQLRQHVAPLVADLEVVLVDDGSGDGTWETIRALADRHHWVRGASLLRNYGQHNALLAGLRMARMPLVATIDDDLQNPPDQLPVLLAALTADVDLVYGRPVAEPQGPFRNLASRVTKRLMAAALGPDVHPRLSAFRLFRRELMAASDAVHQPDVAIDVLLSWATARVAEVPVRFEERAAGRSGYTLRKLIGHTLNMVTGYSTRPLRWVSGFGLVSAAFGFALLAYVLASYLVLGRQVAGFTFLGATVSLFSGVQLLSLGVVGEYLGRMHFRTMGKPPYVVRATTAVTGDASSRTDPTPAAVQS